jgi:hypothetical protein
MARLKEMGLNNAQHLSSVGRLDYNTEGAFCMPLLVNPMSNCFNRINISDQ